MAGRLLYFADPAPPFALLDPRGVDAYKFAVSVLSIPSPSINSRSWDEEKLADSPGGNLGGALGVAPKI